MNDKINRGQLVRTYIGEGLAPFKFEYKENGNCHAVTYWFKVVYRRI